MIPALSKVIWCHKTLSFLTMCRSPNQTQGQGAVSLVIADGLYWHCVGMHECTCTLIINKGVYSMIMNIHPLYSMIMNIHPLYSMIMNIHPLYSMIMNMAMMIESVPSPHACSVSDCLHPVWTVLSAGAAPILAYPLQAPVPIIRRPISRHLAL